MKQAPPRLSRAVAHRSSASIILGAFLVFCALAFSARGGILYSETFDTDGSVDAYVGDGKIFSDYVALGAGAAAVVDGKLSTTMLGPTGTEEEPIEDRLYLHIGLGSALPLLSVQFDFTGVAYNAANGAWQFYAGAMDEISDFNPDIIPQGSDRSFAKLNVTGGNPYTITPENGTAGSGDLGVSYTWRMFFNDSGTSQTYLAPTGEMRTLNDNSWSFFIGDTLVSENIPNEGTGYVSGSLEGLVFNIGRNYDGGNSNSTVDNIIIRDDLNLIPEPSVASLALLGIAGLAARRRRGRKA
jgi:hypothetical protein